MMLAATLFPDYNPCVLVLVRSSEGWGAGDSVHHCYTGKEVIPDLGGDPPPPISPFQGPFSRCSPSVSRFTVKR